MAERRGEWPTWLVGSAAVVAFASGLLVSWAVFADPPKAVSTPDQPGDVVARIDLIDVDRKLAFERIESLEAEVNGLRKLIHPDEHNVKTLKVSSLSAPLVETKVLSITDKDEQLRMVMSALTGVPSFEIYRADRSLAFKAVEAEGDMQVSLFDTAKQPRITLMVSANGTAVVRLLDEEKKPRLGMIATHEGDAEFVRFDKFGNSKAIK